MKAEHTPGPWSVRYDYVVQASSFDDGRLVPVAQPYGVNTNGTDLFANARLIAAAPELLEALECMLIGACAVAIPHNGERAVLQEAVNIARAAIRKAKGE